MSTEQTDSRQRCLNVWLKSSPNASWTDLITALRDMDEDTVANDIAQQQVSYNDLHCN